MSIRAAESQEGTRFRVYGGRIQKSEIDIPVRWAFSGKGEQGGAVWTPVIGQTSFFNITTPKLQSGQVWNR